MESSPSSTETINDVIAGALGIPTDQLTDELAFQQTPEWTSLAHIKLMLAIEEFCDTDVDGDLVLELTSVTAIRAFAKEHRQP